MQRNIYLCGVPIIKVKKTENYEKRYFFGIQYKVRKYMRRYDDFVQAFSENTYGINNCDIEVILNNLGEAVVYARTHQYWHKPNALVFGTRLQHQEIFKMFAPEIPVFYCGEAPLSKPKKDDKNNNFRAVLFDDKLIEINNSGKPFMQSWQEYLGVDLSKQTYVKAKISSEAEKSALNKAKALGINLENFVFLMPFARSQDLLPKSFWQDIEDGLKNKGYDALYNTRMFNIEEAYVLVSLSKGIIALRSGFNDVLSEIPVPQHIVYTHNNWHGDLQPMYALDTFPWAAKDYIKEYNAQKQDIEMIKSAILESIGYK